MYYLLNRHRQATTDNETSEDLMTNNINIQTMDVIIDDLQAIIAQQQSKNPQLFHNFGNVIRAPPLEQYVSL